MFDIGSINASPADSANTANESQQKKAVAPALGQDQFMTLLVSQLKNQNPLSPVENTEFISQLATFSSLEKLTSIESILKAGLASPSSEPSV